MKETEPKPIDFMNLTIFLENENERRQLTKKRHRQMEYNKWRKSLPDSCWGCYRFDMCSPTYNCPNNKGRH